MGSLGDLGKGYGQLIQHIPLVIFSADGILLQCNEAARLIMGLKGHVEGKSLSACGMTVVKEDGTPMKPERHPWARAIRTRRMVANTVTGLRLPDGHHRWLQTSNLPVVDPRHENSRISITLVADITSRMDAKSDLEMELQYMHALASCSAGVCPSDICSTCPVFKAALSVPALKMPLRGIYFFENYYDSSKGLCMSCTCEI